jgi:coenzyme F420-reducing hydrogenase delta subunit
MTHHINELYTMTANNKKVYCSRLFLEQNGLTVTSREEHTTSKIIVRKCSGVVNKDTIKVLFKSGERTVYIYGSYHWFDTEQERDAYRAQAQAEYKATVERNKIQKAIVAKLDTMTKEQLESVLALLS